MNELHSFPNRLRSAVSRPFVALMFCSLVAIAASQSPVRAAAVGQLRCEFLKDPLGIDAQQPRLSWILEPGKHSLRDQKQSAYQVLVASSLQEIKAGVGDLWDSGEVSSDQSLEVRYAGKPLGSEQECFWKVRVWDQDVRPSAWSEPAHWTMGLLRPSAWHANWIGLDESPGSRAGENRQLAARMLRREFTVEKKVQRAMAYVCGLGLSEFYLNGKQGRRRRCCRRR